MLTLSQSIRTSAIGFASTLRGPATRPARGPSPIIRRTAADRIVRQDSAAVNPDTPTPGITVGAPSVTKNATVTVCEFATTAGLLVRFETNETASLFALGRKSFGQHGEPTKTVNGLGTKAYSSTLAGGKSNTIVVLKNKTELLITANEPLAKLEALAKLILPSL